MYKPCLFKRFSTIFPALFFPYIAHEQTAQNLILSVRLSLFFLLSAIAPKMQVRSRAIERYQRAMRPALPIGKGQQPLTANRHCRQRGLLKFSEFNSERIWEKNIIMSCHLESASNCFKILKWGGGFLVEMAPPKHPPTQDGQRSV